MKILNRIVVFLLGLGVLPALIFRDIVRAVVSIDQESSIYKIVSAFVDSLDRKMEITISIKDIIDYWQEGKLSVGGLDFSFDKLPKEVLITKNWLIAAGVLIVVAVIVSVVIMGCALFTKAHITVMGLSAGGVACLFAAIKCFGKFAAPFVNGDIDLGGLLAQNLLGDDLGFIGSIGSAALNGAIKVDILQLTSAVFTMGVLFFVILLWTVAYYITLPESERKKKAMKKAKAK